MTKLYQIKIYKLNHKYKHNRGSKTRIWPFVYMKCCRSDVRSYFVKKIEQFFAKNATFRFTEPMKIPRNITGFFSPALSSLLPFCWTQLHRPLKPKALHPTLPRGPVFHFLIIKTSLLLLQWTNHWLPLQLLTGSKITLPFRRAIMYRSTWRKTCQVGTWMIFPTLHLVVMLMVSVRFRILDLELRFKNMVLILSRKDPFFFSNNVLFVWADF